MSDMIGKRILDVDVTEDSNHVLVALCDHNKEEIEEDALLNKTQNTQLFSCKIDKNTGIASEINFGNKPGNGKYTPEEIRIIINNLARIQNEKQGNEKQGNEKQGSVTGDLKYGRYYPFTCISTICGNLKENKTELDSRIRFCPDHLVIKKGLDISGEIERTKEKLNEEKSDENRMVLEKYIKKLENDIAVINAKNRKMENEEVSKYIYGVIEREGVTKEKENSNELLFFVCSPYITDSKYTSNAFVPTVTSGRHVVCLIGTKDDKNSVRVNYFDSLRNRIKKEKEQTSKSIEKKGFLGEKLYDVLGNYSPVLHKQVQNLNGSYEENCSYWTEAFVSLMIEKNIKTKQDLYNVVKGKSSDLTQELIKKRLEIEALREANVVSDKTICLDVEKYQSYLNTIDTTYNFIDAGFMQLSVNEQGGKKILHVKLNSEETLCGNIEEIKIPLLDDLKESKIKDLYIKMISSGFEEIGLNGAMIRCKGSECFTSIEGHHTEDEIKKIFKKLLSIKADKGYISSI